MAAYIVRRLIWVIFLLFVVTLVTFVVFTVLPAADPAVLRAGRQPSPELVESIRQQFGLDDPMIVQFFRYIGDILPFVGGDGFCGAVVGVPFCLPNKSLPDGSPCASNAACTSGKCVNNLCGASAP